MDIQSVAQSIVKLSQVPMPGQCVLCSEGSKVPIKYEFYGKMSQECSQAH